MAPPVGLGILASAASSRRALAPEARERIIAYLCGRRSPDGGFQGRSAEAGGDLYYSFFGLAGLIVLGAHTVDIEPTAAWLESMPVDRGDLDDLHRICLVRGKGMARRHRILTVLVRCGAFTRFPGRFSGGMWGNIQKRFPPFSRAERKALADTRERDGLAGNLAELYGMFLRAQLCEDTGAPFPEAEARAALAHCICPDGGFGSAPGMNEGVTSATAAGLVLQARLGLTPSRDAIDWLKNRQDAEGGFAGAPGAPMGDLLSTAVALFALQTLRVDMAPARLEACEEFVSAHWNEDGGFCGTVLDPDSDVEYTFYGLLALGCLNRLVGPGDS